MPLADEETLSMACGYFLDENFTWNTEWQYCIIEKKQQCILICIAIECCVVFQW